MIKKLLFLFVASIIGIISMWADATTMPFSPTNGAYYSLKEKTTGLYVNIVESSDHKKDVVLGNAAEAFTFTSSGSSYTIKNISGDYIGKYTNNWNMDSRTAENWTIIDAGNGEIKLSCDKGQVGLDSYTAGSAFYRDKSSGCTFVVEEMQEAAPETYLYTINFVASNGNKYMLSVNENTGALETTAYTSTPSAAQIFQFNHWSNGKYSILHGDKYLGYDRLYTEFNKSLNFWEVLSFEGVSSGNISGTVPDGSVYLKVGQRSSTSSMIGVLIVSNTTGAMNSSTSAYFNDTYTSAILLEEVELQNQDYTLRVAGAPAGTVVSYNGEPYEDGDVITICGIPAAADFTAQTVAGYSSKVAVDPATLTVTVTYTEVPLYGINFTNGPHSHQGSTGSRVVTALKLGEQTIAVDGTGNFYQDLTATESFTIEVGATIKPAIVWNGMWMHGFVYVDSDASDRQFTESELVSCTALTGSPNLSTGFSEFSVPSTPGDYRMRYKVDWVSKDPGGASDLCDNGGSIFDVMLHVQGITSDNYTVHFVDAPEGAYVTYRGEPYEDGNVIAVSGTPAAGDFTPSVIDHYSSSVSIDNENKIITITYKVQIDVNYRIYVDGTLVDTKVVTEIQGEPTTFTLEHPDYVSVTGIPSVVTEATVDVYTTQTLPIVPGDAHFYNIKIKHGTSYPVIYVNPNDGASLKTIADIAVTFENQNYFQWSFMGNWYTGFALLNKQTQRYVSFGSANPEDDTHAVLVETPGEGSYFDIVQNSGDNYLKIHGTTDSYINQYGGNATYLTNWNSPRNIGDNGSKIEISEAEQITSDQDYRDALALAQAELQRAESLPALFTEQAFTDAEDAIAAIAYDAADKASVDNAIAELTGIMKNFRASAAGRYIALLSDDSFNTRGADYYLTSGNTSTERMTATPTIQVESVFTLAYDADQNDYTIQTALSGQYLPVLAGSSTPIYTSAEAGHYTIVPQGEENRILLTNVEKKNVANNGGVHIDASANIVVWGSTIAASHWVVVPVSQEEYDDLCLYHVTIHINNPAGTVEIGGTTYHDGDSFVQDSPIETSDVQPAPIQGCEVSVSLPHTARTIAVVCCYYTPYEISQCGTPTEVRYWADADHEHMQQTAYVPGHTIINLSMYGEGEPGEQHTLHYQVLDDKGNVSPVRSISYIYDKHQQVIVLEEWEVLKRFHDASMMQGEWTRNVWSMEEGRGETADESLERLPGVSLVDGHVRSIDLSQSGITGDVLSLAELPELEHLNLSGNAIANVELPLIRETATANLRNQTITDTKNIVWDNPTEQSLTENLPNIMRISADARSLAEQYTWTFWNAPTATGWRMSLVMQNAMPELRQVSSRIYDNVNGGNATLQVASGISAGTTLPVQFFYLDGDANLSGTVDVLDVQTVVNESFGIGNGFLNKQAADLQSDGSLNVLDLVRVVNVLLAQEMSSQSATTRHMAKTSTQNEGNVSLECKDGSLLLESTERVSALDLWLRLPQGCTDDDVENLLTGFDMATRQSGNLCHIVLYSPMGMEMDGMGEALLSVPQGTTLLKASAANAEANSLSVSIGQTTNITEVTATQKAGSTYDLQGRISNARGLHITKQRGIYTKSITK